MGSHYTPWSSQSNNLQMWAGDGIPPAYRLPPNRKQHYRGKAKWQHEFAEDTQPAAIIDFFERDPGQHRVVQLIATLDRILPAATWRPERDPVILVQHIHWRYPEQRDAVRRMLLQTTDRTTQYLAIRKVGAAAELLHLMASVLAQAASHLAWGQNEHAEYAKIVAAGVVPNPHEKWDHTASMAGGGGLPADAWAYGAGGAAAHQFPQPANDDDVGTDAQRRITRAAEQFAESAIGLRQKITDQTQLMTWSQERRDNFAAMYAELLVVEDHYENMA